MDAPIAIPAPPPAVESLDAAQRERRDRILDAALSMLLTMEYDRIQIRDVTAAAGVALGTTYRYFPSKDHLMAEALMRWASRFPTEAPAARGRSVDRLKHAYRLAVRAFEPHPTLYGAFDELRKSPDPYAIEVYERFAERQTAAFESFLPRIEPQRRADIVRIMSSVLQAYMRAWAIGRVTIDEVYRMVDVTAELLLGD